MTLDEILKGIDALSSEDKAKVFEGKNKKLNDKDTEIAKLKAEVGTLKLNEKTRVFNDNLKGIMGESNVKDEYTKDVKLIAGINIDDDKKTIKEKLSEIKKDSKYKLFFNEGTSVKQLFNQNTNINDNKSENKAEKSNNDKPMMRL